MRLRYNRCYSFLNGALDDTDTTNIAILGALKEGGPAGTSIATVASPDVLVLCVDDEVIHVTAYTSGATVLAAVLRGQDGTDAAEHATGARIYNTDGKEDFGDLSVTVAASNASLRSKSHADYQCDGTADDVVIQAAYDALSALGVPGVVLSLTEGAYLCNAAVLFDDPNVVVEAVTYGGFGVGPVLKPGQAGAFGVLSLTGAVSLKGLSVQDDGTFTMTVPLVTITADAVLTDCMIDSANTTDAAVMLDGAHVKFRGGACGGAFGAVRVVDGSSPHLDARDTYFYSYTASEYAVDINDPTGGNQAHLLVSCVVDGGLRVVQLAPLGGVRILGGIYRASEAGVDAVNLDDCDESYIGGGASITTTGSAESALRAQSCTDLHVGDITIPTARRHGIYLTDVSDAKIGPGRIDDIGRVTTSTYSGILLDGDSNDNFITGWKIRKAASGNGPLYGIRVGASTCDTNVVTTNDLKNSSVTGGNEFSDAGTGTVVTAGNRV